MNVLVVAAHPDDEVLGCGATAARLASEGHEVSIAILGEGITSRFADRSTADPAEVEALARCSREVGAMLGARHVSLHNQPDNRFDSVDLLDLVKIVEGLISDVAPEVIFTHHGGDLNVDHGLVHRSVLTATRPVAGQVVRDVYAFEVPSSTEWALQRIEPVFRPNTFVDVSEFLQTKIDAMARYEGEVRPFPHPRSPDALTAVAMRWGSVSGLEAAEAFELVRSTRDRSRTVLT